MLRICSILWPAHLNVVPSAPCLLQVLGIQKGATLREIKLAFFTKAKLVHPDVCKEHNAHQKFQELAGICERIVTRTRNKASVIHAHRLLLLANFKICLILASLYVGAYWFVVLSKNITIRMNKRFLTERKWHSSRFLQRQVVLMHVYPSFVSNIITK